MDTLKEIMVVGQTPPPTGGQALMIKKLIDAELGGIRLSYVPMAFSKDMNDIGRFRIDKLLRLPFLIGRIWTARFRNGVRILYYAPGGETATAIARDIAVLVCCRFLFEKVIFHVHAGGFTDVVESAPLPMRVLARIAYRKPDLVIQLTEKSPPDGRRIKAKRIVNVPNGLADEAAPYLAEPSGAPSSTVNLLFVGMVCESKGILVLLRACALLKERGLNFRLRVMGRFHSPEFEVECNKFLQDHELEEFVDFLGVVTGDDKWNIFNTSDIFCFPSFFQAENQSLAVLEAMQFGLPVVATDWRSLSTMVEDGETGFMVPIGKSDVLAERIASLIEDSDLRSTMGEKGRHLFLSRYTDGAWRAEMASALRSV